MTWEKRELTITGKMGFVYDFEYTIIGTTCEDIYDAWARKMVDITGFINRK